MNRPLIFCALLVIWIAGCQPAAPDSSSLTTEATSTPVPTNTPKTTETPTAVPTPTATEDPLAGAPEGATGKNADGEMVI